MCCHGLDAISAYTVHYVLAVSRPWQNEQWKCPMQLSLRLGKLVSGCCALICAIQKDLWPVCCTFYCTATISGDLSQGGQAGLASATTSVCYPLYTGERASRGSRAFDRESHTNAQRTYTVLNRHIDSIWIASPYHTLFNHASGNAYQVALSKQQLHKSYPLDRMTLRHPCIIIVVVVVIIISFVPCIDRPHLLFQHRETQLN